MSYIWCSCEECHPELHYGNEGEEMSDAGITYVMSLNKRIADLERQLAEALGMLREAKCPNRCIDGVMPRTNLCEAGDVDQCQWCAMRDAAIDKSATAPESLGNPEEPKE